MKALRGHVGKTVCRWLWIVGLLLLVPLATGCQGCRSDEDSKDGKSASEKEDEKPKDAFEFEKLAAVPDLEAPASQAKPGHWVAGHRRITANEFDFLGSLKNRVLDGNGRPIPTELTDHYLTTERPVSLPKGQTKDLEVIYYIPRRFQGENMIVTLDQQLFDRGGRVVDIPNGGVNLMPEYRYFFVVLSQSPGSFAYVKAMPTTSITGPLGRTELYRVVVPTIRDYVPLPSDSSAWTSFAFLLWDDLDPAMLDPNQQRSLIDWLHFGGQIIVSSPGAVDLLESSFLGEYLPANSVESRTLQAEDVSELNEFWTIASSKGERVPWQIGSQSGILGSQLELSERGEWVPHCEGLVAETAVGRGRIVMTAFPLSHRSLLAWPSYDSFFNSALMRRPRRGFRSDYQAFDANVNFYYEDYYGNELDPRFFSTLRYITRDLGFANKSLELQQSALEGEKRASEVSRYPGNVVRPNTGPEKASVDPETLVDKVPWHIGGYRSANLSGVAGWNDGGAVSRQARSVLDSSAGISPPSAKFVLAALALYLVVLVPVNWLVFRLIGRVEWAWIAAPILAIIAAVGVVRTAQLDIGFARSQTELTLVEMHNGYSRAHVTRYASLYTSLSTEFSVDFSTDDGRGQPWGSPMESQMLADISDREVRLSQSGGLKLTDLLVNSNSAEMLHLEQMMDMGGAIQLTRDANGRSTLRNGTTMVLQGVGILGRTPDGEISKSWVGTLDAGQSMEINWTTGNQNGLSFDEWEVDPITSFSIHNAADWIARLDNDGDGGLSLTELRAHEDFRPEWRSWFYETYVADSDDPAEDSADPMLNESQVDEFLTRLPKEDLWLGGLIGLLRRQLVAKQGNTILVGWTDEPLTGAKLAPVPSQINRRTLVLVHLDSPEWNEPLPDVGLFSDANVIDDEEPIDGTREAGDDVSGEQPTEDLSDSSGTSK